MSRFYKNTYDLFTADGFVSYKTGEIIPLSLAMKAVYLHMSSFYAFYTGKGREYYEGYDRIAERCRVTTKTVQRAVSDFEKGGVFTIERTRGGAKTKNVYKEIREMTFVTGYKKLDKPTDTDTMDTSEADDGFDDGSVFIEGFT